MKQILLLGAGRSSGALIQYLLDHTDSQGFSLKIGDIDVQLASQKLNGHKHGSAFLFNVEDASQRGDVIKNADLVISLLPPSLHFLVAQDCLEHGKNLVTASYVSKEILALDEAAKEKGILFLNECGLDPGLDHMSAMEIILKLKKQGAKLLSFKSYTGGLIAPESIDNLWGYKFTWNPRNVILAGQGTAKYIKDGLYHYIPYHRLFKEAVRIKLDADTSYDGYANRDSLAYRHHYGIENIPTLIRGTLRHEGFCSAWQVFIALGLTDDSFQIENSENMTYREWVNAFIPPSQRGDTLEEKIAKYCEVDFDGPAMQRIISTGILEDKPIGIKNASPAQILQQLLESKWVLKPNDKDMIVMLHEFEYELDGDKKQLTSSLQVKGDDIHQTAMAKTVGLPLAIAALQILAGKIKTKGVQIPVHEEIFTPILKELEAMGIRFIEQQK
jgi:saccharopine dehydrogenase-like NADP-dependent oxidoreductase